MKVNSLWLSYRRGFTLIELLVVIAIVVIMAGLAGPSLVGVFTGTSLTRAASMVQHTLEEAHQYALSLQNTVQVRFYRNPPLTGNFSALQLIQVTPQVSNTGTVSTTYVPLGKVVFLPTPNVMITTTTPSTYSSLFTLTPPTKLATDPTIPGWGQNYDYVEISFYPSGRTDLSATPPTGTNGWYVTLASSTKAGAPVNYYTIQVDPMTGKVTFYRP